MKLQKMEIGFEQFGRGIDKEIQGSEILELFD